MVLDSAEVASAYYRQIETDSPSAGSLSDRLSVSGGDPTELEGGDGRSNLSSQAVTPLWVQVPAVIADIVTALGLVVAGAWSYVRFVRGRTLHASCSLGLSAKQLSMPDGTRALKVTATITNSGGLQVVLPLLSQQLVTVYRCDAALWGNAIKHEDREVVWNAGVIYECNLLKIDGAYKAKILEPGERLRRYILVPILYDDPCVAYRIYMEVNAVPRLMFRTRPSTKWDTELVFGGREANAG